ncbi:glycosyl transferase [Patiriisocius marinus]|uniref:Glycosyl transferase n=1 Tax=Patiriisocius marinus TaxID=1397112 RepID=A0A5J4J2Y7_9FLAO|nr:glycosyltransferase family 4 protein [Patiriisocius marinus]GER60161.1 glycosyl transferase [Patiriisocius marinus]
MRKLIRITTIPLSLEKLLEGQLTFMKDHFDVTAISAEKERLEVYGKYNGVATKHIELTRKITPIKDLKAVYELYRYLKKEKPLIVHTHTPKAGIVGIMAAYFARVPLRLHTVAGLPLMEATGMKRKVLDFVEKLTYKFSTNVYPNSKGLYDFILSEKFTKPSKLKVLGKGSSNGIDTSYFDPSLYSEEFIARQKRQWNIPLTDFVFVFVGRMVADKGVNEMVGAFQQLLKENSACTLLLVGPFEEELDPLNPSVVEAIKTNNKIVHAGYQNDVRPFFAMSDGLVFPSYREGFPNVVLQAGAMGLPAIVSNINGCNEIVTSGENGIIIPVKDEAATLEAMRDLSINKEFQSTLKKNARKIIVENYDRQEMFQYLLNEYKLLQSNL